MGTVELLYDDVSADRPSSVVVHEVDTDGLPGEVHATLTLPSTWTAGAPAVFSAPANTSLAANTTYAVVVRVTGSAAVTFRSTLSNTETPADTDWAIADTYHFWSTNSSVWTPSSTGRSMFIRVNDTLTATTNNAPEFSASAPTRSVAENTAAGENIGDALPEATDADSGDTLTYSLEGTDKDSFTLDGRQLKTKSGVSYDYETKTSYSVTLKVDDGNGGTDTLAVTVDVTDVEEKPDTPEAPTVTATSGSDTSLDVSWTAPGLNGGPAITGYEVQYRKGETGDFTARTHSGTGTTTTIAELETGESYQVQVKAKNGETDSDWSSSGTGSTNAAGNTAATGAPTITGTAQVGQTLMAVTSGIVDANGLTSVSYTYQWIRVNGTDADISGATSSTYTLVAADEGKTIKVRVTFTDDASNPEMLTSAATATVTMDGTADPTAPRPIRAGAAQGGTFASVLFSELLTGLEPTVPAAVARALTVTVDGVDLKFDEVTAGTTGGGLHTYLQMNLPTGTLIYQGQTVTVSYDKTAAGADALADTDGNQVASFADYPADNQSTVSRPANASCFVQSGETELWSATLTVGTGTIFGDTYYGYEVNESVGSLSSNTFTFRTNTIQVLSLNYIDATGESLLFGVQNIAGVTPSDGLLGANNFILCLGSQSFAIDNPGRFGNDSQIYNHGLSWSDGETVAVKLKQVTVNAAATGAPTVTGTAEVDQTLTADTSGIRDDDGLTDVSYTYQWIRVEGGTESDIAGARSSTYTLVDDDEGKTIKVKVTFTDDADNPETLTSAPTAAVTPNTAATGAPTITGSAQVGRRVDADTTGIMDADGLTSVSYTYQWIRVAGGTESDIAGARSSTYTLVAADEGKTIKVEVTFTDDGGNPETLTSAPTPTVTAAGAAAEALPALPSGETAVQTFQMVSGGVGNSSGYAASFGGSTLTPSTFTFDGTTYTVTRITTSRSNGGSLNLILSPHPTAAEVADLKLYIGASIVLNFSDVFLRTNNAFIWLDSSKFGDSTTPFLPRGATVNLRISQPTPTAAVNTAATGAPTITGTAQVDQRLTAVTTGIRDADGLTSPTYTYQWIRVNGTDADIAGATSSTYTLVAGDEGKTIKVKVTFDDDAGNNETLTSAPTAAVTAAGNTAASGAPTITGAAQVDQTLTAVTTGIRDADGLTSPTYTYQWIRVNGTDADIAGATSSTYTLVAGDEGKTIKVKVTFDDDAGNNETLTSAPTAAVTASTPDPSSGDGDTDGDGDGGDGDGDGGDGGDGDGDGGDGGDGDGDGGGGDGDGGDGDGDTEPEPEPFGVEIVGVPDVAVAGESYELTAQSDEASLVYAWSVDAGTITPDTAQTVVWTAPATAGVAWIHVDVTREDGTKAGQSAYVRVEVPEPEPEPVPALPLLGQLLLALGLLGLGVLRRAGLSRRGGAGS